MKKCFLLVFLFLSGELYAQTIINRDPEISKMVDNVSADTLAYFINKLVSFGTRNTLSTQTDPKRGIGAARKWVLQEFNDFAKNSDGRLTAVIDTVTLQPDGKRVDVTVMLAM